MEWQGNDGLPSCATCERDGEAVTRFGTPGECWGCGMRLEKDEKRCAVYTRKSTDERLDTEFNSLDAQYDACASYIKSQVGMGWRLVEKKYDDGGYSGGTMNRPALTELIKDIEAGKIDVVVVYKIDRLSATSPTSPSSLNNTAYRSCRSPSR